MSFTVAAPGTPPRTSRRRLPLAPLKPSRCPWYRETADGEWAFERGDDDGTTWTVARLPGKTIICGHLGSLGECRAYVASGEAQEDLDRIRKTEGTGA